MDENTQNTTRELLRYILSLTDVERHSVSVHSTCQFIHCTFPINDLGDHNITCGVTPAATTSDVRKENLFSLIAKHIHLYIYPLFILMGILGNSLSCFIMFLNVRRSGYPTSLYLTILAFVDCLFLLGSAIPDWLAQVDYKLDIKHLSDFSCRFVYWFGHFTTHLSAGLVVGVTVERFIAVQYPLIAHKVNTVTHTRIVLIVLIIFFFLLDSPVLILVKHFKEYGFNVHTCNNDTGYTYEKPVIVRCALTNRRYEQAWVYVDLAVYTLIPFFIIVTLNSLIIRRLIDAQRFRQRMFSFNNNNTSRYDQQDIKHRHYSESHEAIELIEAHQRHSRRFQSTLETQPLAIMLRPQLSQIDERRMRFNTKQSSISTELSTLSFELKLRSHHRFEISSIRHKSMHTSNSNNTRLTILLLFVSCSFLALTLPAVVLNLIMSRKSKTLSSTFYNNHLSSKTTDNNRSDKIYYTIARLLMIINHSINFILYFVLGKRFRRDLKQLFTGYWRKLYRSRYSNK
ncbi:unnamed protein product [Adineta steineri]|uniref:G-protein coupled receptors family 1 profile domain-containing protein n=1 Tax=Adineta steineri TaxID=433720 RepID=A0A813UZQ3_9BILA|nr:unnamed protein product [Adineta steineri]CAF0810585.1 unnamed protein product [Adineta steineri]CAF0834637.1 unnamed protein product [Adineta steineri]CAF3971393.1 unnamed protein product [Adineta steineri]